MLFGEIINDCEIYKQHIYTYYVGKMESMSKVQQMVPVLY